MQTSSIKYITIITFILLGFVGCEEILFEPDLSDKNITISTPSEGSILEQTTVNFVWDALLDADSYQFQIASPDFASARQLVIDSTMTTTDFQQILEAGTYVWRVRALSGSARSPYSTANFKVIEPQDFTAREVAIRSPETASASNQSLQTLEWAAVSDATLYTIELVDADNRQLESATTADTSISLNFPEGTTTWRVRAEKGAEKTMFSNSSITIDLQKPNQPVQTIPDDKSNTSNKTIQFEWTRASVAGTTEFDSLYIFRNENLQELETKRRASSPAEITVIAGTYYWQVKSFDRAGNQSDVSETFSVTIN